MITMPPPRYRIVERGRRLITVDTMLSREVGLAASLPDDPVFRVAPVTAMTALRPHSNVGQPAFAPPQTSLTARLPPGMSGSSNKQGRWATLLIAATGLVFVLFLTNLWIIILLMMLNGTTRSWLSAMLKPVALKAKAWADGD
jgi:hypothetical protein